jgi:heptosyltransferase III
MRKLRWLIHALRPTVIAVRIGRLRARYRAAKAARRVAAMLRRVLREDRAVHPGRRWIAVARLEHLGDIVATEPVARYLRTQYPEAQIIWFVRRPYDALLAGNPHVDRVVSLGCLTEWIHLSRRGLFDVVVDLHAQGRCCPECRKPLRKQAGDLSINGDNYYEFGTLLQAFCRGAGLPPLSDAPRVYIPDAAVAAVDALRLPEGFVVAHCESNEESRNWQPHKWGQLLRRVALELGKAVVVVGTGRLPPDVLGRLPEARNLCGQLSIMETAEVIRRAALFIGIDSGPAHLANAAGTPGVILLGRYRAFDSYLPYSGGYGDGTTAEIVRQSGGPASLLSVEQVLQAARRRLDIGRPAAVS